MVCCNACETQSAAVNFLVGAAVVSAITLLVVGILGAQGKILCCGWHQLESGFCIGAGASAVLIVIAAGMERIRPKTLVAIIATILVIAALVVFL